MLGRLFKQSTPTTNTHANNTNNNTTTTSTNTSSTNLHHQIPTPSTNPTSPSGLANSYEDSYTREILYGTHNANQLKPYQFNSKLFRVIISQDGGNLRSKQVLFDSANDVNSPAKPSPQLQPNHSQNHQQNQPPLSDLSNLKKSTSKSMVISKIYHNMTELNDYMFGCGLPSNENQSTTKIHTLPPLTNSIYGPYPAILITRLFSISDAEFNDIPSLLKSKNKNEWSPHPALRIKETSIRKISFKNDENNSKNSVNSRFAIGIVIPLGSFCYLQDVIFNNWQEITHFIIILQKLIYKKLLLNLNLKLNYDTNNNFTGCQYLVNKRIQFPNYILQGDLDINSQLFKLIKTVHYNFNIPKLINSNTLMKSSANNDNFQYNPMLINWVLELLNWLEFKDGKHSNNYSNSFLASLFALLIPLRKSLSQKPFSNTSLDGKKEITRVVIMTGNPVVAKKLIFILNGLIPNSRHVEISEAESFASPEEEKKVAKDNTTTVNTSTTTTTTRPIPIRQDRSIKSTTSSTDSVSSPSSTASSSSSTADNSLNKSAPSIKGWEIPNKSCSSVDPYKAEPSYVTSIPFKATASPGSLSMAYLSSSLNSSYSSSNYSLSKLGGSFMEKWKNSFGGTSGSTVVTPNGGNSNITSNGSGGGGYFDDIVHRRSSTAHSLRTPSPVVEFDDYSYQGSKPINIVNGNGSSHHYYGNNSSIGSATQVSSSLSMTPSRLSRTQSMYDLYNKQNNTGVNSFASCAGGVGGVGSGISTIGGSAAMNIMDEEDTTNNKSIIGSLEIKRSKTSVFVPLIQDNMIKNITEHDKSIIKKKCKMIMGHKPKIQVSEGNVLQVKNQQQFHEEEEEVDTKGEECEDRTIFKHKALIPVVAFSDEFRPEFTVQSCPINPKLEQQVMSNMKNDLLFYQNNNTNNTYNEITSRTIFISLRAREIKLIEMNIKNTKSALSPISSSGASNAINTVPSTMNNTYKTKIKKVFTPMKNTGDKELIDKISHLFEDISQLFTIQQQVYQSNGNTNNSISKKEFHDKLCGLVLQLIN
ncbi:hypothetical protein G210_4849 [Candida maltosa Xu316]|uniref:Protein LST4 n=1 Tax=Candida maltosa (strain Xu316) TaxID=1245528 RepID=M3HTS6_CANMX|nr:hypothetical protein G210_4849 [Candida maltosa Xu316]